MFLLGANDLASVLQSCTVYKILAESPLLIQSQIDSLQRHSTLLSLSKGRYTLRLVYLTANLNLSFNMNIFRDVLTQAFILLAVTCPSFSYPNPGETSDPHELLRRAGTTSYFGDYTGSTSSYPDGSGTYIRSEDVGTYASGIKCWTDLVSSKRYAYLCFQNVCS